MAEQNQWTEKTPAAEETAPRDRWATVVDDVAVDAHARAETYPGEALVPEGGE